MPDRRTQILVLLQTRFDHLPTPVRRDPTSAGFVHRTLAPVVCPTCDGVDVRCADCGGRGELEIWRTRDPYAVQHVAPYGLDGSEREHQQALDTAIGAAERQLQRFPGFRPLTDLDQVADANRHAYAWERARAAMYRRYDYRALDLALEQLASQQIRPASERGLELLDRWLPNPLRAPDERQLAVTRTRVDGRRVGKQAVAQRDREIVRLLADGKPVQWVAGEYGLHVSTVYAIAKSRQRVA